MNSIEPKAWWQKIYDYPKAVFAVLVLVFLWPITLGAYALQYDAIDVYLPWRFFGSESLRMGEVPLWNPYQDGGYPFYADHQYSIWNPELFLSSLFGRFSPRMQQYWFLFYFWMAGVGFLFLGKQLDLSRKSRFLGGIILMFSGVLIGHGQSIISILGGVWLPWAIGAYLYFLKNPFSFKEILVVSTCLFLMLTCGYQAVSIMLFYVLLVFFMVEIVRVIQTKNLNKLKHIVFGHGLVIGTLIILMAGTFYSIYDVSPYLKRLGGLPIENTDRFLFHPKSLESLLLPISSLKQEWEGSTISTQSFFLGTSAIFLSIIGLFNWKNLNSSIKILGIFGLIYGITSFGSNTPLQPFLAEIIPGFNQFYYASFFRFFLWIFIIILVCVGIESLNKNYSKLWIGFSILILGLLSILLINTKGSFWTIDWGNNYIALFRDLNHKESIFFNGVVQFIIFGFGLTWFLLKRKLRQTIFVVLFIELFVSIQMMLPVTVHEFAKTETLSNYLSQYPEGFPIWDNSIALDEAQHDSYASFWRNQGNFSNTPNLDGWTSFHLAHRDSVYDFHPTLREKLGKKSLFYTKKDSSSIEVLKSDPTNFEVKMKSNQSDTLIFQQANYPGWTAKINGEKTDIFTTNIFEMGIVIPKGELSIQFEFNKPVIKVLYYVSMFGFLLLLSILAILYSTNKKRSAFGVFIALSLVLFQLWKFSQVEPIKNYSLNSENVSSEQKLIQKWNQLGEKEFKISSGNNNLSTKIIGQIAIQSDDFVIENRGNEMILTGKKASKIDSPLSIDSTQMYLNFEDIVEKLNKNKTNRIIFSAKSKNKSDFDEIELLLIKKKGNNDALTLGSNMKRIISENDYFVHYNSIAVPILGSNESFALFLYNISSKERNFIDFKIELETKD